MADENMRATVLGVAAATASLAGGVTSGEPLSATAGLMDLLQHASDFLRLRQERIVRKLLEDAYFANGSDSGAFFEFRALFTAGDLKSEDAKNVFVQTVRAAEAAVDEAVYPALAMLMRQYVREERRYDGFFRSCSRLLQELSADEYASFAALMRGLAAVELRDHEWPHVNVTVGGDEGECVVVHPPTGASRKPTTIAASECPPEVAGRLFYLLDREGLARTETSGSRTATTYLTMQMATARRIARIVA